MRKTQAKTTTASAKKAPVKTAGTGPKAPATGPKRRGGGDKTILPEGTRMISIHILGKKYEIPETLTIMKAVEHAGYTYVRGCGCRGGICGACGTFYRLPGDFRLRTGLACQTVVQDGMVVAQVPFFPANRAVFDLDSLGGDGVEALRALYPEVFKCVGCATCSRTCPMDIDVMYYIALMKRGDLMAAARESFDCIQCGLCAIRCPAQISQYTAAQFVRRVAGRYLTAQAEHLKKRVADIEGGKYVPMLADLARMTPDQVRELYVAREREPDLAAPGTWMPKETKYL